MKYDAFISYRHSDLDLMIAKKLHKGLETFRVPRAVAKKSGKKNIKRVFRDQEELPIGSNLGDNIESALAASEFLIVICSPRTPESYWVQKEISTFIGLHGRERVLAVLIEGEPDQSFPKQLLEDEHNNPVEPLAADLRGSSKKEIDRKLRTEIIRLAAPLLYCSYDDLRQRHRERKLKRIAAVCTAVTSSALLFGVYSAYNAALIRQNYEEKQQNQSKYLAETSLRLLEEGDRRAAVLVALDALPSKQNNRPYVAGAQYALSRALRCYDTGNTIGMDRILQHDQPVRDFWQNSEGTRAISLDQGDQVYVWNVENGENLARIKPRDVRVNGIMLCGENAIICDENILRSLSLDGQESWRAESPETILHCEFDENSMTAACVSSQEVTFYDMTDGKELRSMPNPQESYFTMEAAFNGDRTKFAVAHLTTDQENGCVSVYDFHTEDVTVYPAAADYICEMKFTSDDQLVMAVCDSDTFFNTGNTVSVGYLQKIDLESKETLWQQEYEYRTSDTLSTNTHLLCRRYTDSATESEQDEILLSNGNTASVFDNRNGTKIAETGTDSGIVQMRAALSSTYGYLAQSDGSIDIVDMTNGMKYPDSSIKTKKELQDISIRGGVLMMRSYASPELTVMKYQEGAGMEALSLYEDSVKKVEYSGDESFYAINLYGSNGGGQILFYRTKDNSCVGEWSTDANLLAAAFVNDTCYVMIDSDGKIHFFDAGSGQTDLISTGDWSSLVKCRISKKQTFALLHDDSNYAVWDLQNKSLIRSDTTGAHMEDGIVSDDGKYVYCSFRDADVKILETDTGNATVPEASGYKTSQSIAENSVFALSGNGRMLAVYCQDHMIRILDLEQKETAAEIPFTGMNHCFMEFSPDDNCLLMQGDDYYFRVYDLKQQEFNFIAAEQYYRIQKTVADQNTNTISLITDANLVIVSNADYDRVAQIEGGVAYLPKHGRILCTEYGQMYQFPYMNLEMLRDEAKKQFGKETLSKQEKIKYHAQ